MVRVGGCGVGVGGGGGVSGVVSVVGVLGFVGWCRYCWSYCWELVCLCSSYSPKAAPRQTQVMVHNVLGKNVKKL